VRTRALVIALAAVAALGVAGLVRSATRDERWTAFSLDVPPSQTVVVLGPHVDVCQGPIQTVAPVGILTSWVTPIGGRPSPALAITIRDGSRTGPVLATGHVPSGYTVATAPEAIVKPTVPEGREAWVCVRSAGPKPVDLIGNSANSRTGVLTVAAKPVPNSLSFLFLRPHPVSLLSQVPAIFDRAALFRPTWVGAWTFWVLAVLVLAAFGVGVFAVVQAQREDELSSEQTSPQ
jgi:hypothetical protein